MYMCICRCTHLIWTVSYCRNNSTTITNPVYIGNTETIKAETLPGCEGHIYDPVDIDEKEPTTSTFYQNPSNHASSNADCATIKPNQVPLDGSYMPNANKENTAQRNKPKPLSEPENVNKPFATPVAEAQYHLPISETLPPENEYAELDVQYVVENQYASMDEANGDENDQYALPQDTHYQELDGQPPSPSKYTIPRKTPDTN